MASADFLKQRIDLHDLADKLGLQRDGKGQKANYHAPHRADKNGSLSIYDSTEGLSPRWIDHTYPEDKGSCIDLVMYVECCDVGAAIKRLHQIYGYPMDEPDKPQNNVQEKKTKIEWLADKVLEKATDARAYLIDVRKIPANVVDHFIKLKVIGFNDWTSEQIPAYEKGHCGPAVAFPVRCLITNRVVGIDNRFFDAELNGGLKTKSQGEKSGYPYIPDVRGLRSAHTVIIFESAINALSAMAALDPQCTGQSGYSALATRGLNVENTDWRFLAGKFVILAMDNDQPIKEGRMKGRRPGPEADWKLNELLTALNIPSMICDKRFWEGINDCNDLLREKGLEKTKRQLLRLESWLIPGLPGSNEKEDFAAHAKRRLYLPDHDFRVYWQYRTKADFTSYLRITKDDEDKDKKTYFDLCGFRVADLSKVRISGATAALTGEKDHQPNTIFSASCQVPREKGLLVRQVFTSEQVHNVDLWKKFGPIWRPQQFSRMVNILERSTHLGGRNVVNFVGLAWLDGKPVVNEGPDCYFTDPNQQCPYHNLQFPSGPIHHAALVIEAYSDTFKQSSASILLTWALGGHLKAFLGFYPHFMLQAAKDSGKSTLIKRLERTIAFTMLSGQSVDTPFRLLTSVSHTTHPVGWEELSARGQRVIDSAVAMLQESYNYTITRRGSDMLEFVMIAPVLLAGEDVPVDSLLGKLVTTDLANKKGVKLPENLPQFPVKEWLLFLTSFSRSQINDSYQKSIALMAANCVTTKDGDGGTRIRDNYACLHLTWILLCEFANLPTNLGDFTPNLISDMNRHITETTSDREPWIWIMGILLTEIDGGGFRLPYVLDMVDEEYCLIIRATTIMHHIKTSVHLKAIYDSLPVKSDRVLKKQLIQAGVVAKESMEKKINNKRHSAMMALSIKQLQKFGLNPTLPESPPSTPMVPYAIAKL